VQENQELEQEIKELNEEIENLEDWFNQLEVLCTEKDFILYIERNNDDT
jgi:cell division protein FtsB